MKVGIEYYLPCAAGLAVKMDSRFGPRVDLIAGGGGVFEIVFDDQLIYRKKSTGAFPDETALLGRIDQ